MKKVILKINDATQIIEDIGESYTYVPVGYTEVELSAYPNDLVSGCYRYEDGNIVKDEVLYGQFLQQISEWESRLNS